MIYLSAKHISIKKNQDRSSYDVNKIVLCDGVGEFRDSDKAAEITLDNLLFAENCQEVLGMINQSTLDILRNNIVGGTTFIYAKIEGADSVKMAYLGNGSVFHLHGNFYEAPTAQIQSNKPFRYSNILLPHVDKDGGLLRHISHQSTPSELIPSFIELSLTGINGDIILIFTDGISTLEEDLIIADDHGRIWRNQSESVAIILEKVHQWLQSTRSKITQAKLDQLLEDILLDLKQQNKLEDDASIGLIFTESVLEYYNRNHVA